MPSLAGASLLNFARARSKTKPELQALPRRTPPYLATPSLALHSQALPGHTVRYQTPMSLAIRELLMDILILLALVAFGAAVVGALLQKPWALGLVAAGLFLTTLSASGWIAT